MWLPLVAGADTFELKTGGRVDGSLVSTDDSRNYFIATPTGGQISIPRSEVARVVKDSDVQRDYIRKARSAPDTVEAHLELAEWCRERKLSDQLAAHYARILELDPDHEVARQQLGYRKQQGRWLSREELMSSRGMVWHSGRYRSRQEIEILERTQKSKLTKAEWGNRLERWRRHLADDDPERVQEALVNIHGIRDPTASDAVVRLLRDEPEHDVKLLLVETAARIDSRQTIEALAHLALEDADEEIREQCLEYLLESRSPGIASLFVRALTSKENEIVNRAAVALQTIGDSSAISPLIDALVTEHRYVMDNGTQGNHAYSMSSSGGFSFGGRGPRIERRRLKNPAGLTALVRLSENANFGYDEAAWQTWLASRAKLDQVDLRRDE
jgi:hypothetical protein